MSDNGRYLLFISHSNQHVDNDPHPADKIGIDGFIYDRMTKQTNVIPLDEYDSPERQNGAQIGSISSNGRYVIFNTRRQSGEYTELFLYDQQSGKVELLLSPEMNHPLIPTPSFTGIPHITSDGKHILFSSSGILYLMTRDAGASHVDAWEGMN